MKKINLTTIILAFLLSLATNVQSNIQSRKPLWEFQHLTPTNISISRHDNAIIKYKITNKASGTHTLIMSPIQGIKQITGPDLCSCPLILPSNGSSSCTLLLKVEGSQLIQDVSGGPILCTKGSLHQCYRPKMAEALNIKLVESQSQYTLGGSISGLTGTVVLLNNATDPLTRGTNGQFIFTTPLTSGKTYNVTVGTQPPNQTCTVNNGSGTVQSANITNVNVICTTNTYTVGGSITGLTDTLVLLNNGSDPLTRSTDGQFTFTTPLTSGETYAVTVGTQPPNQTCTVTNRTGTIQSSNVTNVTVVCSTNAYTVGGQVSGLLGSVELTDNGTDALLINSNGPFTFPSPVAEGSPYLVAVQTQPGSQTCTINNGSGIMGGANVTNVSVICSMNTHTVGGSVSGLSGSVTLENNSSDPLIITSNGNFVFPSPVAQGSNYNVMVAVQPSGQTCGVLNGSGTIGNVDVTNVSVTCTNDTTTLSVDSNGTIPASLTGTPTLIQVQNTGSQTARNVHINLPLGWNAVIQNALPCSSIGPGQSCTLSFTSTQAYVAQNCTVTGDNISNTPSIAIAFTVQNFLVWQVSSDLINVQVIDTADIPIPPSLEWGGYLTPIGTSAQSPTDGFDNTLAIVHTLGTSTNYAAQACNTKSPAGTWYLPAICQMGAGNNCIGLPNIDTNLAQLGFGGLGSGYYWSSTEDNNAPSLNAWRQLFNSSNPQPQSPFVKNTSYSVRCARSLSISIRQEK